MIAEKLILETDRLIYDAKRREEKKALEIAKKMLDGGMTVEQVLNFTDLPLNKIRGLQAKK